MHKRKQRRKNIDKIEMKNAIFKWIQVRRSNGEMCITVEASRAYVTCGVMYEKQMRDIESKPLSNSQTKSEAAL